MIWSLLSGLFDLRNEKIFRCRCNRIFFSLNSTFRIYDSKYIAAIYSVMIISVLVKNDRL